MPDKEITQPTPNEQEPADTPTNSKKNQRGLIIGLSVAGLLLIGIFIGGGLWVFGAVARQNAVSARPYFNDGVSSRLSMRSGYGYGNEIDTQVSNGTVTTTVYTYQTGVVVAVNSNTIVIAGGGKQTTIDTNSSTTYVGGVKPAVNDTVRVAGTTANSTITATSIAVIN